MLYVKNKSLIYRDHIHSFTEQLWHQNIKSPWFGDCEKSWHNYVMPLSLNPDFHLIFYSQKSYF